MHNEELHDLSFSRSIIRVVNLRRMRWTGHLAQKFILDFDGGNMEERYHLENLNIEERISLKYVLKKEI